MGSELSYPSWDVVRELGPLQAKTVTGPHVRKHPMLWFCVSSGRQPKGQRVSHCFAQDRHLLCQPPISYETWALHNSFPHKH